MLIIKGRALFYLLLAALVRGRAAADLARCLCGLLAVRVQDS